MRTALLFGFPWGAFRRLGWQGSVALRFVITFVVAGLAGAVSARAATYQVGPTQTYHTVGSLPALNPGDNVEIDSGTYNEVKRWTTAGTAAQPIAIRGVGVARPIFDATATDH